MLDEPLSILLKWRLMSMNAQQFIETFGRDETERVCKVAGTSLVYFQQVVEGKRNFSRKLAEKLEEASDRRMDRVALVFGSNPPPAIDVPPGASDPDQGGGHARP